MQKAELKARLKEWEQQFHATNGRKPSPKDIDAHPHVGK